METSAQLAIRLTEAVAGNAGNTFAGRRVAINVTHKNIFIEVHADRCMATNTEIAVGGLAELQDCPVHCIEYRAQLRVGVLGYRPFAVMFRVAVTTGGSRRKVVVVKHSLVRGARIDYLLCRCRRSYTKYDERHENQWVH